MARVMVIAGGTWQCPIVKLAKSKGHYVICSNLYEDSPAFEFADESYVANVLDKEKNLEIAKKVKPDVVLTEQSDIAVPTVAYIAEKLGIRGIGIETAERFTNKFLMREYALEAGFPSPKYAKCFSAEEAKAFLRDNSRCIIKPLDSQSSRGVHIIETDEDIDRGFEDCIQYSNSEKAIIIEEYIEGTEFTVDGLKTLDSYYVTAISEKKHYEYNPSVANRLFFTNSNPNYDYDRLREVNTEIVRALGLPFGLTHAEYKYKDGNFYLIEIAARGGGTKISSDIVPLVSGINSNEVYLDLLCGKQDSVTVAKHYGAAVLGFFDFKPGKVVDIFGLEEAKALKGVREISLEVEIGAQLGRAIDDRSRCGYYILYAETPEELNKLESEVKELVKVVTE